MLLTVVLNGEPLCVVRARRHETAEELGRGYVLAAAGLAKDGAEQAARDVLRLTQDLPIEFRKPTRSELREFGMRVSSQWRGNTVMSLLKRAKEEDRAVKLPSAGAIAGKRGMGPPRRRGR